MALPDVHYGEVTEAPLNWRELDDRFDDVDDDEESPVTPRSVIAILGFDPLDMEGGDEIPAAEENAEARASDADRPAVDQRSIHGLDVVVEYPKGAVRRGNDWKIALPYDYGFLRGVPGADGDSLDVALGSGPDNHWVYIFDQRHAPPRKGFDESKVFINWPSMKAALDAFSAGHNRAHDVYMDMTPMPIDAFKTWLLTHDMKTPAGMVSK